MASIPERPRAALNEARKSRDQARTLLLSNILADLKNRELDLNHPASDDEAAGRADGMGVNQIVREALATPV